MTTNFVHSILHELNTPGNFHDSSFCESATIDITGVFSDGIIAASYRGVFPGDEVDINGSVYIFQSDEPEANGSWKCTQRLMGIDPYARFGDAIVFSAHYDYLAVGAPSGGADRLGRAYLYKRPVGTTSFTEVYNTTDNGGWGIHDVRDFGTTFEMNESNDQFKLKIYGLDHYEEPRVTRVIELSEVIFKELTPNLSLNF